LCRRGRFLQFHRIAGDYPSPPSERVGSAWGGPSSAEEKAISIALTHETAPTQYVVAGGVRFAHRRFGKAGERPLVFLQYFNANMDGWDPAVINGLAADREVVLFDNAGVAGSDGRTPSTVAEMAADTVVFCGALGFKQIDVVGFSLGGMIAQQLALDHPAFVRRIILMGTAPRGGEGLTFSELSAEEQADPVAFLLAAFFTPSSASRKAGRAFIDRMAGRKSDRDASVSRETADAQLAAIRGWGAIPSTDRYSTLKDIGQPILIVHGNKDIVVTPINALLLAQHLPDAQLIMYPDASHGAQFQHGHQFLQHAKMFLNDGADTL